MKVPKVNIYPVDHEEEVIISFSISVSSLIISKALQPLLSLRSTSSLERSS